MLWTYDVRGNQTSFCKVLSVDCMTNIFNFSQSTFVGDFLRFW